MSRGRCAPMRARAAGHLLSRAGPAFLWTLYNHARVPPQTPDVVSPGRGWWHSSVAVSRGRCAPVRARAAGHLLSRSGPASVWTLYDHARVPQTPDVVSPGWGVIGFNVSGVGAAPLCGPGE